MIFCVAIQKGGTAKTTTAAALLQAAAYKGKKALAVDLDPQGNLTFALGADPTRPGSFELLNGEPAEIQTTAQDIDVISASWGLSTITSARGSARRLQTALEPLRRKYSIIVIDTPPTAGELQYNALQASDGLIIPLQADVFNVQALYQITDTARQFMGTNQRLKIKGYILTQYDGRSTIARRAKEAIEETAKKLKVPCLGIVRQAVAVKEAAALQTSLFKYAPKAKPTADYLDIYESL